MDLKKMLKERHISVKSKFTAQYTLQQIESLLLMRRYDGLLKTGKIKGRTGGVSAY